MKSVIATLTVFVVFAPSALGSGPYVKVSPNRQSGGNTVKVFGWVGGSTEPGEANPGDKSEPGEQSGQCKAGSRVTIYSNAFAAATTHSYRGTPALYAKVQKNGKFSAHVTIDSNVAPRSYKIKARCGGRTFAHTQLTVTQFY